jgi:hypothetical protein
MPNAIKYNVSAETLALKKGNFWIGTGDVGKGPTLSTGFYNGLTPPSGGYTIYLNKASGGPSIYTVNTEAQMVSLTNSIGSQSFTTSGQCLNWFATQTDKMIFNIDYPAIVTNGLVLNLDAGFTPSYPTTATTWYDVSSGGNNGTLTNGPTFNSANNGSIVFDGVDDYAVTTQDQTPNLNITSSITLETWLKSTAVANSQHGDGVNSKGLSSDGNTGVYETLIVSSGEINYPFFRIRIVSNTPTYFPTNISLSLNQIYHFVSTYDGSTMRIFINGVEAGTGLSTSGNIETNTQPLCIGVRLVHRNFGGDSFFSGNIFTNRIYNRALSQSEITQNYNAQKGRFGL